MSKTRTILQSALVLLLLSGAFGALLFGLNGYTAPLIAENDNAAELAPLYEALPTAKGFELLYDAAAPESAELGEVAETVRSIYREKADQGYVLRLATTEGYTGEPIELSLVIDGEGRIANLVVTAYPDTKELSAEFVPSFQGQDSAMPDVGLVAGVTYSSSAVKNAVNDGFEALIGGGFIGAGVKSDDQVLTELLTRVFPGMANGAGVLQAEELEPAGAVLKGFRSLNGGGSAYIVTDGGESRLVLVNLSGEAAVYNTEGLDVTDTADAGLIAELQAASAAAAEDFSAADSKRLTRLAGEGAELEPLALPGVYNTVTNAYRITVDGQELYGLVSRSYGYTNLIVTTYYVLDDQGAIAAMTADEFILIKEYFTSYELDEAEYRAGFEGLTEDSFTGEQALIAGATVSTEAVNTATHDVFEAFRILKNSGVIA